VASNLETEYRSATGNPEAEMESVKQAQIELGDASKLAVGLGVIDASSPGSGGWYACCEVESSLIPLKTHI